MPSSRTNDRLDFEVLSMSELRNRPGEVLDRVSENGSAFIIEKNGQRKACLVPLSAFLPDIAPTRIARELRDLDATGETPRTTITEDRELAFRFKYELADSTPIELRVVLPHGYPNLCPRVYATIDENVPHRWADGALCLFGVTGVWNPGKHTVATALLLARQWLQNYDYWRKSGNWPRTGFHDE